MDKYFCISVLLSARDQHWRPQTKDSPLPSRCDYMGWEKYVLLCSRVFHLVRLLFHIKRQELHHVLSVADAASPLSSHCMGAWIREACKTDDRDEKCAGRVPVEWSNQELDVFRDLQVTWLVLVCKLRPIDRQGRGRKVGAGSCHALQLNR